MAVVIDDQDFICSNCGKDDGLSRESIQHGIGGGLIGFCHNCVEKLPKLPDASDRSIKADKARETIRRRTVVGTYRTKLQPLVERTAYRPRIKPIPANPMSLWDE